MEPVTVFLCGSLMPPKVGPAINRVLIDACGQSHIITLPLGGLAAGERTYKKVEEWFDRNVPSDQPIVVVGQSQGGLHAVRLALSRPNVERVITLSTPHHGTDVAHLARILGPLGTGLWDMRPTSPTILAYAERLPEIAPRLDSIYMRHDGMIRPYHSCHVDGARNFLFATSQEFRTIGPHLADTTICDGSANHFSELFNRRVASALREARHGHDGKVA